MAVNEAEETFKRLMTFPGVQGIIVMNRYYFYLNFLFEFEFELKFNY
jgi:hypothetical protein